MSMVYKHKLKQIVRTDERNKTQVYIVYNKLALNKKTHIDEK